MGKKGNETHFGYKDHAGADEEFKLICVYGVTGAATHDSEPYLDVMPQEPAYAESVSQRRVDRPVGLETQEFGRNYVHRRR